MSNKYYKGVFAMNILAIGNSFSQDATRYIHRIARADGFDLKVTNLFIGGCSLERHFRNMHSENEVYGLEFNGEITGFKVTLKDALLNRDWDYITIQQASHFSFDYDTYQPYLTELCTYIRKLCPKAKLLIHQTWSYAQGSVKLERTEKYIDQKDMFIDLENAYNKAAKDIDAEFVIKSGELLQKLLANGIETVHRDSLHLSLGLSRYAVALLWYAMLSGNDVSDNTFCDFDEAVTDEEISIAKKCVKEIVQE